MTINNKPSTINFQKRDHQLPKKRPAPKINIDINSLPRGVYYVSMSRERERESLKFVIGN